MFHYPLPSSWMGRPIVAVDLEGLVERAAGAVHAQGLVEDRQGVVDGVDHALGLDMLGPQQAVEILQVHAASLPKRGPRADGRRQATGIRFGLHRPPGDDQPRIALATLSRLIHSSSWSFSGNRRYSITI